MKKVSLKGSVLLWVLLSVPFSVFGQGDDEDAVEVNYDALLVEGVLVGNLDLVEDAMANGAHLNQQLNDEGQTPLALAEERLQEVGEGDQELREAYEAIIAMLQRAYAPSYVMYTPAYDDHGHYIMPPNSTGNVSALGIHRRDLNNLLMLIGSGSNYAFQ